MRYKLTEGPQPRAQRLLIYGPEGIGKTTMASQMPNPVFVDVEDGSGHLYVRRMPVPPSWDVLMDECRSIAESPEDCMTIVVDSADAAERLCWQKVCQRAKKDSIEAWGYGKGYVVAAEEYRKLLEVLDMCIAAGVNVVLIAHSQMRKFERPDEAGAYDRFEVKLNKHVAAMTKEWADAVLFLDYETFVSVDEQGKGKATGGKRIIRTSHNVSWDAKNRWGLPDRLELDDGGIAQVRQFLSVGDAPKSEPVATPEPKPEKQPRRPSSAKGIPKRLQPLFALTERDGINPEEVKAVMVVKGKRDREQAILDWEEPFIEWVVNNWARVTELVSEQRKKAEEAENIVTPF